MPLTPAPREQREGLYFIHWYSYWLLHRDREIERKGRTQTEIVRERARMDWEREADRAVLFLEYTRLYNGFLCLSCGVFDLGAMSPLLWSFEERDKIMIFFDYVCGCRMHCAYLCLMGVVDDISFSVVDFLWTLLLSNFFLLEMFDFVCSNNRIGYLRLRGIGLLDIFDLTYVCMSGVVGRAVGFLWDCRVSFSYELLMFFISMFHSLFVETLRIAFCFGYLIWRIV